MTTSVRRFAFSKPHDAFPPQHARMKSRDALPGSLQKLPTAHYALERPHWCMDIMKQRRREDGLKAPFISDLNKKSDHPFMNLSWNGGGGVAAACERLSRACAWISTFKSGLGTDLARREEQKARLLCLLKTLLSYWVFWFLLSLVHFLDSENVPSEWPKS